MEVLSEHLCQGWLEGYLLTGRHGLFNCYEAFIHIVDSMFNQHAKWLKVTRAIPWRRPIASLNYLLSSHVWRQDHNGFSHQDPGFIDHVVNKKAEIIRVYLPPDANTLLSVMDHCLRSRDYVNVVVAGKQPTLDWLSMDDAILHCTRGIGTWDWASSDAGAEPDVVLACAGDVPTLEVLAAAALLREHLPELKVRVVNVVDLMRLQGADEHPHGLSDHEFDALFTAGPAGDLRLPRLPVAHPPPDLPAHQPPQPPRARLQGGGHDHDALRHGHAQRHGPLPPRHRRDRPRAGPRAARRAPAPADGRRAPAPPRVHARASATTRPTCATGPGRTRRPSPTERARPRRQRGLEQPQAAPARPRRRARGRARPARPDDAEALEAALAGAARAGRRRPPRRARRRALPRAPCSSTTTSWRRWASSPTSRRCTSRRRWPASRPCAVRCPTCPRSPASTRRSTRRCRRRRPPTRCRGSGASASALRRFGFHGLSHAYASRRAAAAARA